jgi:hypothetical protein
MKIVLAAAIACAAMLSGVAFAQPPVSPPAEPKVPGVQQRIVREPPPPEISSAWGTRSQEPVVHPTTYGACRPTQCANGEVPASEVHCPPGQFAACACDGFCDNGGNPQGLNRCACQ